MNETERNKNWHWFTFVWSKILSQVLDWSPDQVQERIAILKRQMESESDTSFGFDFFYEGPMKYIMDAILGSRIQQLLEKCKWSPEANQWTIYNRLVSAMFAGSYAEISKDSFDWIKARERYVTERQHVENWLADEEAA